MEIAGTPSGEFVSSIGQDVKSLLRCEYLYIKDVAQEGVSAIPKLAALAGAAVFFFLLGGIILTIALAYGISQWFSLSLGASYGLVGAACVLIALTSALVCYYVLKPRMGIIGRLTEHWQRFAKWKAET